MPVDLTEAGINLGISGVNRVLGTNIPELEGSFGGSKTTSKVMDPFIADDAPNTAAERFGRRIGQEVGASVVPVGGMMSRAAKPLSVLGLDLASSVGSGVTGQVAEDMGGNDAVQTIAAMVGGGLPIAASRAVRSGPQAPSIDDMRDRQARAYEKVDESQARLSQQQRDDLVRTIRSRTEEDQIDAILHPRANRVLDRADVLPETPLISDVERYRRMVGRDVAGSADAGEAAIGVNLKQEIDDYLAQIAKDGGGSGEFRGTLDNLMDGRDATRRIKAAEKIEDAIGRGVRRAATSGTGGNEINAIRQNLSRILDNPRLRRGYTADELKAIGDVVMGIRSVNAMRLLGWLSPDSVVLPLMTNMTATGGGMVAGGPLGFAFGLAP
ncbi:MAG: hypothetical protein AAF982_03845, partial [Pseudomonadota bacterium]